MSPTETERRKERQVRIAALKFGINEDQMDTLITLERFGWSLKFVRETPAGPLAVVHDPDKNKLAVIEIDGTLNEEKTPKFRE
jgi:hypothetical protein